MAPIRQFADDAPGDRVRGRADDPRPGLLSAGLPLGPGDPLAHQPDFPPSPWIGRQLRSPARYRPLVVTAVQGVAHREYPSYRPRRRGHV